MEYQLVPMAEAHIPQIAALEEANFSQPWSESLFRDLMGSEHSTMLVAEGPDGTVLGYAGLTTVLDEGYIDNIAVDGRYRRQGVAQALLGEFIRRGREGGLAFLTLEVRASNAPAIALYEKMGFELAGRRRRYYDDPPEDALLMTLKFHGKEGSYEHPGL